ncbi:hypothetical protein BKA62DRAFT_29936 [Auriculariales sp. MPI-PUGE-AT-0066]|nr:hypothetical protein BKA62DRAFT_29936 [Auriculariales sp. MPI-PUGE-AT-0066]
MVAPCVLTVAMATMVLAMRYNPDLNRWEMNTNSVAGSVPDYSATSITIVRSSPNELACTPMLHHSTAHPATETPLTATSSIQFESDWRERGQLAIWW